MTNSVRPWMSAWASGAMIAAAVSLGGCVAPVAPMPAPPPAAAPMPPAPPPAVAAPLPERFADEIELRIATLHRQLNIQPGQEVLFDAYADAMRANAHAIHALFLQRVPVTDFTAPARLRWYAQLTAAHAEATSRLIAPFDALYQSLSDQQKAAADRYFEQFRQRRKPIWLRRSQ
ncbi:MAG TPA: Spy/CpxP family protein refolding chaperone [Stellaceae bacterium]|nr:Spy/CpxP family protein refolding chaperone [Stellaceae bacterium]